MNFANLNVTTLLKGAIVAFLSGLVGLVGSSIMAGTFPLLAEWIFAAKAAGLGAAGYVLKALFQKPTDNYSAFFSINWRDFANTMLMLATSTFVAGIAAGISEGHFPDLAAIKSSALKGLMVAFAYFIKNLFTNSEGEPMQKE